MIAFSAYMQEWLYGKNGYYRKAYVGKEGDFYTSVCASRFFGGSIAYYLLGLLEKDRLTLPLKIIEIGSHRGELISDVAEFLSILSVGVLQDCEFISIEPLEELAIYQKNHFSKYFNEELKVHRCFEDIKLKPDDCAFVISNELFDAFSCEIIDSNQMAYIKNHQLIWGDIPKDVAILKDKFEIEKGELSIGIEVFIDKMLQSLNQFKNWRFLSFDYGDWGQRNEIDLRAYQKHQVYNFADIQHNLEKFYQNADITYDVDFSLISKLFESLGAEKLRYAPQGKGLIELGLIALLEEFSKQASYESYLREASKIRALIAPGGLGERFQLIEFGKQDKN